MQQAGRSVAPSSAVDGRERLIMPGVSRPLYQMKADFFKTLGHPVRIRVLELLSRREHTVSEMLTEIEIEAANLSQQLSILRRAGLVTARREGLSVTYRLTTAEVADLLAAARAILTGVAAGQVEALEQPA
jgi:ArsR family transcriptional regulator